MLWPTGTISHLSNKKLPLGYGSVSIETITARQLLQQYRHSVQVVRTEYTEPLRRQLVVLAFHELEPTCCATRCTVQHKRAKKHSCTDLYDGAADLLKVSLGMTYSS